MATTKQYTIHQDTQARLVTHVNACFETANSNLVDLRTKMAVIDMMYARFKTRAEQAKDMDGLDIHEYAKRACEEEFADLKESFTSVDIPLLVSQVDTAVAYMADLWLSGSPIFPVVSDPKFRATAEYIESLVDNYASIAGYPRQLLMFFLDAVKYNFAPIHIPWNVKTAWASAVDNQDLDNAGTPKLSRAYHGFQDLQRLDPYNTIYDFSVTPGNAAEHASYAGWVELMTPTALAAFIEKLEAMDAGYFGKKRSLFTIDSPTGKAVSNRTTFYNDHPSISNYIDSTKERKEVDWHKYFGIINEALKGKKTQYKGLYEVQHLYTRISPKAFGLNVLEAKDLNDYDFRIYRLIVINGEHLMYAEPVYSAFDRLPVLIGAPKEDGLGLQTLSVAESTVSMQKAVDTLMNIRFHSARRAISDRALYDSTSIDPMAVNSPNPSAKIPVNTNSLTRGKLSEMYHSIPYDPRGTDAVVSDAIQISAWTNELNGFNRAQQGQFQKGNKTRDEFNTVMSNAEMRQRLPAIVLEFQVFLPFKQQLKLNISRFSKIHRLRSATSGKEIEIDLTELRNAIYDFKIGDGYSPASQLASTDLITAGMQLIGSSEPLQMAYGAMLPNMFAHMMQLGGVKGLENYLPDQGATNDQAIPNSATPGVDQGGL